MVDLVWKINGDLLYCMKSVTDWFTNLNLSQDRYKPVMVVTVIYSRPDQIYNNPGIVIYLTPYTIYFLILPSSAQAQIKLSGAEFSIISI